MTRHARNSTAGSVYTYHEKKKDARESGFGTERARLTKDSVNSFDSCSLSLQMANIPVVTKEGFLFDKEVILKYIISKKNEYNRKLKEYERQKSGDLKELEEIAAAQNKIKLEKFMKTEKNIKDASAGASGSKSISNMSQGKDKALPSFWVPSNTPDANRTKVQKPDSRIYCPITGKPLKMKDLIDVKFTQVNDPDEANKSLIAKESRYMCPVTKDVLTNAQQLYVIKTTGDVVTGQCFEKIIKKDWIHPLTNEKLTEKDLILLQRGGTGFASSNELQASSSRPALQC